MAYRDMSIDDFIENIEKKYDNETPEYRNKVEQNLIYLCTFGLEDKIRDDTIETISEI